VRHKNAHIPEHTIKHKLVCNKLAINQWTSPIRLVADAWPASEASRAIDGCAYQVSMVLILSA